MKMKIRYLCVSFFLGLAFAFLLGYMILPSFVVHPWQGVRVLLGTIYPSEHCSYTLGYPLEIPSSPCYSGISLENITTEQIESVLISLTLEDGKIESFVYPESYVTEYGNTLENWEDTSFYVRHSDGLRFARLNNAWLLFLRELKALPVEMKMTLTLKEKTDETIKVYITRRR